jgi:S1-C subfamily serine protease
MKGRPVEPYADSTIGMYARIVYDTSRFSDMGMDGRDRVMVTRVAPKGPAAQAGIRPGDQLLAVDKMKVSDAQSLISQVRNLEPGSKVSVTFLRNGKKKTVPVRVSRSEDVWGWTSTDRIERYEHVAPAQILIEQRGESDESEDVTVPGLHTD